LRAAHVCHVRDTIADPAGHTLPMIQATSRVRENCDETRLLSRRICI
jgi:hypothetical protein